MCVCIVYYGFKKQIWGNELIVFNVNNLQISPCFS